MFARWLQHELGKSIRKPYVHILFGARQTGKSTIIRSLLGENTMIVDFSNPAERSRYLVGPECLIRECTALPDKGSPWNVFIDEAQNVPSIFDAVQHLYYGDKKRWRFIICGSSARKLRNSGTNLLPGRSMLHHLYPLTLQEQPFSDRADRSLSPLQLPSMGTFADKEKFPSWDIVDRLAYGSLPGIVVADKEDRPNLLRSYSAIHLEEEIRRETMIRDLSSFARFLAFSAMESGRILNYTSVSNETGVTVMTIKSYYQILEDMFIGFSIPAFTGSTRKYLLSTPKFFFFDLGVRNAAAGLRISGNDVLANPGPLFEQWVGIELWKMLKYSGDGSLYHYRTKDGAEIDYILETGGELIPIEVKWTERPSPGDARHMLKFISENKRSKSGIIICRCPRPMKLHEKITALPWNCL